MTLRRILLLSGVLLILYLGMYSWNQRTQVLDKLATNIGLEISGAILTPWTYLKNSISEIWNKYFELVGIREENEKLKQSIIDLESHILALGEDISELSRLRELIQLPEDKSWRPLGVRIISGRLGPNSVLDTIIINRGYSNGGKPGTPIVTNKGLVGRILRSSAHTATVLLISDPSSKIAVFSQKNRNPGILTGTGPGKDMEVNFVQRNAVISENEILITSGLDGKYPKGIPVAQVTSIKPSDYTQFMAITAKPLANMQHLEEALLLESTSTHFIQDEPEGPAPVFVGPQIPSPIKLQ